MGVTSTRVLARVGAASARARAMRRTTTDGGATWRPRTHRARVSSRGRSSRPRAGADDAENDGADDAGADEGLSSSFAEELRKRERASARASSTNPFDRLASGNAPKFASRGNDARRTSEDDQLARSRALNAEGARGGDADASDARRATGDRERRRRASSRRLTTITSVRSDRRSRGISRARGRAPQARIRVFSQLWALRRGALRDVLPHLPPLRQRLHPRRRIRLRPRVRPRGGAPRRANGRSHRALLPRVILDPQRASRASAPRPPPSAIRAFLARKFDCHRICRSLPRARPRRPTRAIRRPHDARDRHVRRVIPVDARETRARGRGRRRNARCDGDRARDRTGDADENDAGARGRDDAVGVQAHR